MKNLQRGVSLSGLLVWCVILVFVALLGLKVAPSAMEYFTIQKTIKAIMTSGELGPTPSVADVRKGFDRRSQIDNIKSITSSDLDISKDNGEIVVSFSYSDKIHLFGPVSLLLDYNGSASAVAK